MKILLTTLNSKYVHSNLAIKYLYGIAAGSGLDVSVKEFTINNDRAYIMTELIRQPYDLVCFSTYIWNIEEIKSIGRDLKALRPGMKILLGGPEVSYYSREFLEENPWADMIIRGEGEYPFYQLCKSFVLGESIEGVESLSYRKNHGDGSCEIIENPNARLPILDKLPFPYNHLPIEIDRVIYYESSRGCPFRCSFCLSSIDVSTRALSMERTKREIGYFLNNMVKQVKFIDRTFNYDRNRARKLWEYIIENDNGVTNFHFEINGEIVDEDDLRLLEKARKGLFQFEIGVQTANPYALKAVDRSESISRTTRVVLRLMDMGNIHVHLDMIAGLPHENYRSFGRSFNKLYGLGPSELQVGFLKLLKGTKLHSQGGLHGYIASSYAPYEVMASKYMSSSDMVKIKMIAKMVDLFYNRGGFSETLRFLDFSTSESSFNFYEQLADFYYNSGFQHRNHSKEDLYRILAAFAKSKQGEDSQLAEEAKRRLSHDIENTMNVDAVKRFYKRGWDL